MSSTGSMPPSTAGSAKNSICALDSSMDTQPNFAMNPLDDSQRTLLANGAIDTSKDETDRLEEEGRKLQERLDQLAAQVEVGRRSVEEVARENGLETLKQGNDLLLGPKDAISAVFRIENVAVHVSVEGRRGKEWVSESMGIRVGTAAEQHLEKVKLKDELKAFSSHRNSMDLGFNTDALGLDLNMEEEAPILSRQASSTRDTQPANGDSSHGLPAAIEDHFSSFVYIRPQKPGVPKKNQIIIKLVPKVPLSPDDAKNSIVPKFISSDPAWHHALAGLQTFQGEQAWPVLNPDQELIFESPPPRADAEGAEAGAGAGQMARHFAQTDVVAAISAQSSLISQLSRQGSADSAELRHGMQARELVSLHNRLLSRKEQIEALDVATKTEVHELKEEVQAMRADLDRMIQLLSKIHRDMVTRKAAGPPTPQTRGLSAASQDSAAPASRDSETQREGPRSVTVS